MKKIAWTIAASDSSGGAGIQADLAAFAHFKVHGCNIISKITAQNTQGILNTYTLPDEFFNEQLQALSDDLKAHAIKISVIGNIKQLDMIAEFIKNFHRSIVYDPVIASSTKIILTETALINCIRTKLLPHITLITPNIPEAEILSGIKINNHEDIMSAGKLLLATGVKNVLIKGGHFLQTHASDFFINSTQSYWLVSRRVYQVKNIHGTGCHLSSAITANMALDHNLNESIVLAKRYINAAIRMYYQPSDDSKQYYIPQFGVEYNQDDMPLIVTDHTQIEGILSSSQAQSCNNLGLYPIVDSYIWVTKLINYGVKALQLRIKNLNEPQLEDEIVKSIKRAKENNIKLFINDHWILAIKHKAYGVHLGQEDILTANINEIKNNGLRLGISTHNYYELAKALSYKPSYIALGPIYPTNSKVMPWQPQGLTRINEWQKMSAYPLVVIGGIGVNNVENVMASGAKNVAMISAITDAPDPEIVIKNLLLKVNNDAE